MFSLVMSYCAHDNDFHCINYSMVANCQLHGHLVLDGKTSICSSVTVVGFLQARAHI